MSLQQHSRVSTVVKHSGLLLLDGFWLRCLETVLILGLLKTKNKVSISPVDAYETQDLLALHFDRGENSGF